MAQKRYRVHELSNIARFVARKRLSICSKGVPTDQYHRMGLELAKSCPDKDFRNALARALLRRGFLSGS